MVILYQLFAGISLIFYQGLVGQEVMIINFRPHA